MSAMRESRTVGRPSNLLSLAPHDDTPSTCLLVRAAHKSCEASGYVKRSVVERVIREGGGNENRQAVTADEAERPDEE